MEECENCAERITDFVFDELPLEAHVMVIDDVLANQSAQERDYLLRDPGCLGIACEAHLQGISDWMTLARYLHRADYMHFREMVNAALLARLPNPA